MGLGRGDGESLWREPVRDVQAAYVLACGARYFPRGTERLRALPVARSTEEVSYRLVRVVVPDWGFADLRGGPEEIQVDASCLMDGEGPAYERCDWWRAAFLHLTGWLERRHEREHGPVYSYAAGLQSGWQPAYDRAWVNWILLFLRRWTARRDGVVEAVLFGAMPKAEFDLTHDLDAVAKTAPIRIKQSVFHLVNTSRLAAKGRFGEASQRLRQALRFATSAADYWSFPAVLSLEQSLGLRSTFHVYGGRGGWARPPTEIIVDPGYEVGDVRLTAQLRELVAGGWQVGLHQSFRSWCDEERMRRERLRLEEAIWQPVTRCRQHWLRFSWGHTWRAQEAAGLALDTTLGFNDRPGFRNGCALRFRPWDPLEDGMMRLEAMPLVLMDSHLYDYGLYSEAERGAEIGRWIGEIEAVGGEASLLWHPHVMQEDYGWGPGYTQLLQAAGFG